MKKRLALMLALLMLVPFSTVACSETNSGKTESDTSSKTETTETVADSTDDTVVVEEEPDNGRSGAKDDLPDGLDFGGKSMRIIHRCGDDDTTMEFIADEITGEVVNDAVYTRNTLVEERLNVKIELNSQEGKRRHDGFSSIIRANVNAGSDDYDLIANATYDTMPLTMEGMFLDFNTLEYIDLTKAWYSQGFIDASTFGGKTYAIMGELGTTMISGAYAMFFNKTLLDDVTNSAYNLYSLVNEGEWTIDKLDEICESVYTDANGDGEINEGDIVGNCFANISTLSCDAFFGASRIDFFTVDNDANSIKFNGATDRFVTFTEKMHKLLYDGQSTLRGLYDDTTIMVSMLNRSTIFTTWMIGQSINLLRDFEDSFGIVPVPKLDTTDDGYVSYTHDGSTSFFVPITVKDTSAIGAFVEAMSAESYRRVTPAYYETALKAKYSRDNESAQMLDIITSGVYQDFFYIYGQSLGANIGSIRGMFNSFSTLENATSTIAKTEKSMKKSAEKIINKYNALIEG